MQVSYADFIFVSSMQFFKSVDISLFERLVALDPIFVRLYDASEEWLKRAD
jgi:hypothetical protein